MLKVVVDRKTWLHGEGDDQSFLRRTSDGKKCCLGFACLAVGLDEYVINDVQDPNSLRFKLPNNTLPEALQELVGPAYCLDNSLTCSDLMRINDQLDYDDTLREEDLVRLGKQVQLEFEFVN